MSNLSKEKREKLLEFLKHLKESQTDEKSLIAIHEIENALCEKKYGLVWEKHSEQVDIDMQTKIPVFTEVEEKELNLSKTSEFNYILEGDNLHSLSLLERTLSGRVDLIYIDPPYNTGNKDFVYDDTMINLDDGFRHSKWISFMERRLRIASKLLSSKGSIFISIDDNEQAQLKILCDEIFGESNFIASIVWQKRTSPDARKKISNGHEYILVYSRSAKEATEAFKLLALDEKDKKNYKNPDNDPRGPWVSSDFTAQGFRPNQMYTITTPTGVEYKPEEGHCWKNVEGVYLKQLEEGRFWFGKDGKGMPRRKTYLAEREGKNIWTWWSNQEVGHTQEATQEITAIFGTKTVFDYPKPKRLLKRIIQIATSKDSSFGNE
ncbi:site-specific DNA-methyltransferase [Clostridium sp.]|uniref:site-specific DNA-methyltransferase n=1 Tax=Clostridium sp. TaxID=1506 RepID=UPI003217121B